MWCGEGGTEWDKGMTVRNGVGAGVFMLRSTGVLCEDKW